jgi:glycosyltransferase involved in cell wall biosynthesis
MLLTMVQSLPLISVIIPHYNDLERLADCLNSLHRQKLPRSNFEIIVADNNSIGGVQAVERIARGVKVVHAPEQGAGPARNAGVAAAQGGILAFIDSDCVADENWLFEGMSALARFDYVGGRVVTITGRPREVTPAEAVEAVFAFNFQKYIEKDGFSGTGNLFVPTPIFGRVGGFRAGVSEDMDWCRRAAALNFRLGYAERAVVYHRARRDWRELEKKWDRIIAERIRLAQEQPGWRIRWFAYAVGVGSSPLVHWFAIVRSIRLSGLRAKCCGLLGLVRIRAYRSRRMLRLLMHPPP